MSPVQLLDACKAQGITVYLSGGELKLRGSPGAIQRMAPILKPRKAEIQRYLTEASKTTQRLLQQLQPFELHQIEESAANFAETTRINNMAWEFMQANGMAYSEAIRLAADIVVWGKVTPCEAAYEDVMALWQRLKGQVSQHELKQNVADAFGNFVKDSSNNQMFNTGSVS